MDASKLFDAGVLLSKFGLIGGLLGLSIKNGDTVFVSKKPQKFIEECIVVGASASVATMILGTNRDLKMKQIFHMMFLVFFVFITFHMGMEFSGMNNLDTKEINTEDAPTQTWLSKYILNKWMFGFIFCGTIAMIGLATRNKTKRLKDKSVALIECLLFGLVNGMPTAMTARNRGTSKKKAYHDGLRMSAAYCALYALLEGGGFFAREIRPDH